MMNKTFENAENILFAAFSQKIFVDEESDEIKKSSMSDPSGWSNYLEPSDLKNLMT